MTKRIDPDIKALKAAMRGLDQSSSPRMLRANLEFLWDRYIQNPNEQTLRKIRERAIDAVIAERAR